MLLALAAHAAAQPGDPPPRSGNEPTGGSFELESASGPLTLDGLRGRVVLLNFGYTSCPDICPLTLAATSQVLDALDERQLARVVGLFITLDPQRDSAERLAEYVDHFHPQLIGLTGSAAQIDDVVANYGVQYSRVELPDGPFGYAINHSATTYLITPDGTLRFLFPYATPSSVIVEAVRFVLDENDAETQ